MPSLKEIVRDEERLHPAQIERYRNMSAEEKYDCAMSLYRAARQLKAAGLRSTHPDWPEERVQQAVRDIFLQHSLKSEG